MLGRAQGGAQAALRQRVRSCCAAPGGEGGRGRAARTSGSFAASSAAKWAGVFPFRSVALTSAPQLRQGRARLSRLRAACITRHDG